MPRALTHVFAVMAELRHGRILAGGEGWHTGRTMVRGGRHLETAREGAWSVTEWGLLCQQGLDFIINTSSCTQRSPSRGRHGVSLGRGTCRSLIEAFGFLKVKGEVRWVPTTLFLQLFLQVLKFSKIEGFLVCLQVFKKDFSYLILETGEERERNINVWLPLVHPLLRTWPATQACT